MHDPGRGSGRSLGRAGTAAYLLFLIAALAGGLALRNEGGNGTGFGNGGSRPNVVVIMTDDQALSEMRALRRTRELIAGDGVSFRRAYVTDPLCCPSRATFLTGQYAHNHGVISNGGPNAYPALREHHTLPVWLDRAGYHTALVGKYLNGYGEDDRERVPPGWDDWHALIEPSSQNYTEYELSENGAIRAYGPDPEDYKTDVIGAKAVAAIERASETERPFFLYIGFNAPHAPSTPAPSDAGKFDDLEPPSTPAFNEDDISDKPSFLADRPHLDHEALARIADRRRRSLESLLAVDRQVAAIVAELERRGELGDTYLFFTSDNGYLAGEHRVEFGKLLPYDPASRVPLLLRGPELPRGALSEALVGNIDIAPTIVEIAGAKPSVEVDGRSLLALARDPDRRDGRPLLIESLVRDQSTYYGHPYTAIRTDRYLYVSYETGDEELYDFARDPDQLESRHRDPLYDAVEAELSHALDELVDCASAQCSAELPTPPRPSKPAR